MGSDHSNCKDFYNPDEERGRANLVKSFLEQSLLQNIPDNLAIANKLAVESGVRGYAPFEKVYVQDDFGINHLFFVLLGACNIYINDNLVSEIKAGECFGEFPILDSRVKYSVSVYSNTESCIAKVAENVLVELSEAHSNIWFNMAKMLAGRLRSTSDKAYARKPNTIPKIFIGSSTKALEIAYTVQNLLKGDFDPVVWNQGPFKILGRSYLECLEIVVNEFDFGVFLFNDDDDVTIGDQRKKITRDNVIFELGLFIGRLTRKRAYLVYPKNLNIQILSDFDGITKGSYDPTLDLRTALMPVCNQIRASIKSANIEPIRIP
ncbi:MAG TPA: TIR domain-containing protein [Eudoraea sp.]|nr:TIR domain-containing protein [Eudoraea sp.]